jgi:hypothetical protein
LHISFSKCQHIVFFFFLIGIHNNFSFSNRATVFFQSMVEDAGMCKDQPI